MLRLLSFVALLALACVASPVSASPKCGTGEELDTLMNECVAVTCEASRPCSDGHQCVSQNIFCVRAPCPQFTCQTTGTHCGPVCEIFCEHGNVLGDDGCPLCSCNEAAPSCADGEEYSPIQRACVPVSCASSKACNYLMEGYDDVFVNARNSSDIYCTPTDKTCVSAPCPQFECSICEEVKIACEQGHVLDPEGCPTDVCKDIGGTRSSHQPTSLALVAIVSTAGAMAARLLVS